MSLFIGRVTLEEQKTSEQAQFAYSEYQCGKIQRSEWNPGREHRIRGFP
jgi:hypothetical protein